MSAIRQIPSADFPQSDPNTQLIDVRSPAEFRQCHAPSSRNIPLDSLNPANLPKDQPLYLLCKAGARAAKAAQKFLNAGHTNITIITGGIDAWVAGNLPVERSPTQSPSLERQVRIAAGSLIIISLTLAATIHPLFALITAFIGAGLIFAGLTNTCGMAILLTKCPWNK